MKSVKPHGSTRDQGTRKAPVTKHLPPLGKPEMQHIHVLRRSLDLCPGSLGLPPPTDPTPEGGPIPTAGPEVDPGAPAIPPGAEAGVDGDVEEDGHAPAAAHTEVTGVTVERTVEVIPGVAHLIATGDPGQTLMTAIPVGVGARAGDEGADEVTATGAQTAVPGLIAPPVAVPPDAGVTAVAVGTAEREHDHKVWTLSKHEQLLLSLISN